MLKKIISLMTAGVLTVSSLNTVLAKDTISVKVNGEEVYFDQPPVVENGRTLIPFRAVMEEMGIDIDWIDEVKAIIFTDIRQIWRRGVITIGDNEMMIGYLDAEVVINDEGKIEFDGERIPLDVPAKIVNGRTLIPIRAAAEAFGAEVIWDEATKTVEINRPDAKEMNDAISELIAILSVISGRYFYTLEEDAKNEITSIAEEISTYLNPVEQNYFEITAQQKSIDEVTEKCKEYIAWTKDFAERNNIH